MRLQCMARQQTPSDESRVPSSQRVFGAHIQARFIADRFRCDTDHIVAAVPSGRSEHGDVERHSNNHGQ
jgi:hypothetical protein